MERMQAEAEALGAEGIVGVQRRSRAHTWGSTSSSSAPSAPPSSPDPRRPPDPAAAAGPLARQVAAMPGPDDRIEEPEAQRDAESVAALDRGGLPVTAIRRIAEAEAAGGTWSSDLSVAELAAVRAVGFDPVGLVLGCSVPPRGAQWGPTWAASVSGRRGGTPRRCSRARTANHTTT